MSNECNPLNQWNVKEDEPHPHINCNGRFIKRTEMPIVWVGAVRLLETRGFYYQCGECGFVPSPYGAEYPKPLTPA